MITKFKIYEGKEQEFWLFEYRTNQNETFFYLYPDKKSVEDAIISTINEERYQFEDDDNYTDDMYFIEIETALNWYETTFNDVNITYHSIKLQDKYVNYKLEEMRDIRKFNL